MTRARLTLAAFVLSLGCRSTPSPFDRALRAAGQEAASGRTEAASARYLEAAEEADSPADKVEALYREAHLWSDGSEPERAARSLEALARDYPDSARAARAWLDAGRLRERLGQPERARADFERALGSRAESAAVGESAAVALVMLGPEEPVEAWTKLLERNRRADLDERLRAERAAALAAAGRAVEAIAAYEELVRRHPLPTGTRADEALLAAARLRRGLGDAEGAAATLRVLLDEQSHAALVGSYERGAYAEGRLLLAAIERDDLNDPARARSTLSAFAERHPDSRHLDDALWQLAWLEFALGDAAGACRATEQLRSLRSDSRYVPCLAALCEEATPPPDVDADGANGSEGPESTESAEGTATPCLYGRP
jgi:tetratricopeptide (TPR) repeat protein